MNQISILILLSSSLMLSLVLGAVTNNNPNEGVAYTLKRGLKTLLLLIVICLVGLFLLQNPSTLNEFVDFIDKSMKSVLNLT